jgi:anti-sigma factor RsiW
VSEYHDQFSELLGAYALDAVDPDEQAQIELHLRTCPWCAAEVAEHREVASLLSHTGTDAPEGVWDRIVAELSPPAPPLRMSFSPLGEVDPVAGLAVPRVAPPAQTGSVTPLRPSRVSRTLGAVLAVAACLLLVLGVVAVDQQRRIQRMEETAAPPSPAGAALVVELSGDDADSGAKAVVEHSGQGVLVSHDLPDVSDDELYQLWGSIDGVILSLGTFDSATEVVNFQLDPERLDLVEGFMVTLEKSPGAPTSEHPPVIIGETA